MKQLILIVFFGLFFIDTSVSKAQSFIVVSDTIFYAATPAAQTVFDTIVTGTSAVAYSWKVIGSDFPSDWVTTGRTAFCNNVLCYWLNNLWPIGTQDSTLSYLAGDTSVLDLWLFLGPTATPGCYYVTVRLHNIAIPTDSATETWYVCYTAKPGTTAVPQTATSETSIYPNPVYNELTVQSGVNSGISKVDICDLLGRKITEQQCSNGTAVIILGDIPQGVYFARFINDRGVVTESQKFIKE